jgi:hypothetical protein
LFTPQIGKPPSTRPTADRKYCPNTGKVELDTSLPQVCDWYALEREK